MPRLDDTKQFILIAIKGNTHRPVFGPAIAKIVGAKRSELIKSGNWKGYSFQLRTLEGYSKVPILTKKLKTYEEKRAA